MEGVFTLSCVIITLSTQNEEYVMTLWKKDTVIMATTSQIPQAQQGKTYTLISDTTVSPQGRVQIRYLDGDSKAPVTIFVAYPHLFFREVTLEERRREFMVILHRPDGTTQSATAYKDPAKAISDFTAHIQAGHLVTLTNAE